MKQAGTVTVLVSVLALSLFLALTAGSVSIPAGTVAAILLNKLTGLTTADWLPNQAAIVLHLRLPRVLLAALVGGTLALAGAVLQGLFRNPMADPGLIGVSGGGALGAVVALVTGLTAQSLWSLPVLAFGGAALATWLIFRLATAHGRTPFTTLLLAGLAVSAFLSAMTSLLLSLAKDIYVLREVLFWLLGGLDGRGWAHLWIALGPAMLGSALVLWFADGLNILSASGEAGARSLGIDMDQLKRRLLALTALMTGAVVSVSGIIGFVGLIVPHVVRLLTGPDHRTLLPASVAGGAAFLIWADLLTRILVPSQELRLGVVTAFVGAPFFIVLLQRYRSQAEALS